MLIDNVQNFLGEEPTYKKGGSNMKNKMKKLMKNQKGMTLIELLAVIVIIAIIALIAIPAIGNIINNSKDKAILADASNIISGAKIAYQDNACTGKTTVDNDTCTNDDLKAFVDVDLVAGDKVVKTTDANGKIIYTITYDKLTKIKNTNKYTFIDANNKISSGSANEYTINNLMDGKGIKPTSTP